MAKKAQAKIDRMHDPVRGTATVVSSSSSLDSIGEGVASWIGCTLTCVLQADGITAQTAHERALTSPTNRWPYPEVVLPITVDRADPSSWVVHWGEMATARQANDAQAEALAASMHGEPGAPGALPGRANFTGVNVVDASGDPALRGQVLGLLKAQGVDVDGMRSGAASPSADSSGSGPDEQLARLQKLGELHASGVLTDAEFEAQKAKILGS